MPNIGFIKGILIERKKNDPFYGYSENFKSSLLLETEIRQTLTFEYTTFHFCYLLIKIFLVNVAYTLVHKTWPRGVLC